MYAPKFKKKEDEAAIVIQKHMKGYCARKKYGSLMNPSGKINQETAEFVRNYYKKWKAKSIFQILLLYRASKHLELVYFSQQVHLYNQTIVFSLQQKKDGCGNIKKIKTNVNEDDFLGLYPFNAPAVWKMPFKIKEIPFCDTSAMCGSVYDRKSSDELPWDEPFKSLNKGCQTTESLSRSESFRSTKVKSQKFKNFTGTPYTRDPSMIEKNYSRQEYYDEPENYDDEFDEREKTKVFKAPQKTTSYQAKQTFVPKSDLEIRKPISQPDYLQGRNKNLKPVNTNKINPLHNELHEKGKINRNSCNDDDPPFNFQAMLRKTSRKTKLIEDNINNFENNNVEVNFINQRNTERRPQKIQVEINGNYGRLDKYEILPGFVVYGKTTDL